MYHNVATLLIRNLHDVLGENDPARRRAAAVLLMLNPLEAQMAALALRQGTIALARRDPGDDEIYPMEMSTYRNLSR